MTTGPPEDETSAEPTPIDAVRAEAERDAQLWAERIDLDALLAALVLVPHSYPRNRFFSLYRAPEARMVRRRAARLRSVVTDLAFVAEDVVLRRDRGDVQLSYRLDDLGARRRVQLSDTELALVAAALERRDSLRSRPLFDFDPAASRRVAPLLGKLFPESTEADD